MKKILFALLLFPIIASAQQPPTNRYTPVSGGFNWQRGYFRGLGLPVGGTPALQSGQWNGFGQIRADSVHRRIAYWNGTTWISMVDTTMGINAKAKSGTSLSVDTVLLGGSNLDRYSAIGLTGSFPFNIVGNGIGTSLTDSSGLILINRTPAAAGVQQQSPGFVLGGQGWKTNGGAATRDARFRTSVLPVQGSLSITANYIIESSTNSSAYSTIYTLSSGGSITSGAYNGVTIGAFGTSNFRIGNNQTLPITSTGQQNLGIAGSLTANTTGSFNVAVGASALSANTTDSFNTAIGVNALSLNVSGGGQNTAVGYNALVVATAGFKNTAIGAGAMEGTTTGRFNTAVGHDVMLHNTTGINNSAMGWLAGSLNDIGSNNVSLGWSSARSVQFQNKSVFVGESSGYLTATGSNLQKDSCYNCIAIGSNSYATANNQMRIGNDSLTAAYVYGVASGAGTKEVRYNSSTKQLFYADTTVAATWNTYTPSLTNVTNVASSTAFVCQYMRVGNMVTVSGEVSLTPTTGGLNTELGISLPIASALTLDYQCGGTGASESNTEGVAIFADPANDRARIQYPPASNAARTIHFSFTYQIL